MLTTHIQTAGNGDREVTENKQTLSIVVPVFDETGVIGAFYARTKQIVDALGSLSYEIIFVDDGSKDDSYQKIVHLASSDPNIRVIKLSRNFGHQMAITAGIDAAMGDGVVVIDADLQDPPEVIIEFVEKWKAGYDVVYGVREKRKGETKIKLFTAHLFYRLLKSITNIEIPLDVGDFRLMSRPVVDQLKGLRERDRFVRGLVSWVGFRQTGVYYLRDKRHTGITKFPFRKMIRFALDGLTSFSSFPLKLASWLGYATSLLAFFYLSNVFVQKALGNTVEGWATIMVAVLSLGSIQLLCLGIVGEYLGRIFNESKQRPLYIIQEIYGFPRTLRPNISLHTQSGRFESDNLGLATRDF
jgi:polyisoprenyl-phosphate glycosyltransferase